MKNFIGALLFLVSFASIHAQSELIYVSPKADSLSEILLQNSTDYQAQLELMNEYIDNAHPELGLLEILDLENAGKITSENLIQKAKILFWLQRSNNALHEFVRSYLYNPKPELIKYLIVSDYAAGNKSRALKQLKKYTAEDSELPMKIARLYQELYLNKRYGMAAASQNLLREFDKKLHDTLFPIPSIFMLSGEDELFSTSDEITITFEIRHGVQIRTISVNSNPIYEIDPNLDIDPKTPFSKMFNKTLQIHSGVNQIEIGTEDIYGYKASQNIEVKGLKFPKEVVFQSDLADSLSKIYRIYDSYIPDDSTSIAKDRNGRALFFASNLNDSEKEAATEFWYQFVTNAKTGKFMPENIKFLAKNDATESNFDLVFEQWLMKEVNLQTTALFYLSGNWEFSAGKFFLNTGTGKIDPEKIIRKYSQKISHGCYILFDGTEFNDSSQFDYLSAAVNAANFPVEILVVKPGGLLEQFTHDLSTPADSVDSLYTSKLNFSNISDIYTDVLAISNGKEGEAFTQNPAQIIRNMHSKLYSKLEENLKKEKLERRKIETVLKFCSDWRRYGEMERFYSGITTAEDLFVQADEYFNREAGGVDEN